MKNRWILTIVAFFCVFPLTVCATEVENVSQSDVVAGSKLIFEGKVTTVSNVIHPSGRPFTRITFSILDVLKGSSIANTIDLDFMGGMKDGITTRISEMNMPVLGEHGIYFVEMPGRIQVNPLFGWWQGHYLVIPDPMGIESRVRGFRQAYQSRTLLSGLPTLSLFKQNIRAQVQGAAP